MDMQQSIIFSKNIIKRQYIGQSIMFKENIINFTSFFKLRPRSIQGLFKVHMSFLELDTDTFYNTLYQQVVLLQSQALEK